MHPSVVLCLAVAGAGAAAGSQYLLVSIDDDGNEAAPDWRRRAAEAAREKGAFDPVQPVIQSGFPYKRVGDEVLTPDQFRVNKEVAFRQGKKEKKDKEAKKRDKEAKKAEKARKKAEKKRLKKERKKKEKGNKKKNKDCSTEEVSDLSDLPGLSPILPPNDGTCLDLSGEVREPGETGFSCRKDCNICRGCSCTDQGLLLPGLACTKKHCGNRPEAEEDEDDDSVVSSSCVNAQGETVPPGKKTFRCRLDCNLCRRCACDEQGVTSYDNAVCTKKSCGEDRDKQEEQKPCFDSSGKEQPPGATDFNCFSDCNSCFGCSCSEDGTLDYSRAGCTAQFCGPVETPTL